MYEVASVIELQTGLGVDYNMMSKYCLVCSHNKLDPQSEENKQYGIKITKKLWCCAVSSVGMEHEAEEIM